MVPASKPKTQRPTVTELLKNTQFWVALDITNQYHHPKPVLCWERYQSLMTYTQLEKKVERKFPERK